MVASVVRPEADALGLDAMVGQFVNGMSERLKGGSYDICMGGCGRADVITRDTAGIVTLPFRGPNGAVPTDFVFGSFIANELTQCATPPCGSGNSADSAVNAPVSELLRPAIRLALESWAGQTTLELAPATAVAGLVRVQATLGTIYGGHLVGQTVAFSAGGAPLCTATTDAAGSAICSGRVGVTSSDYTGTFSATNGLPAATASASLGRRYLGLSVSKSGTGRIASLPAGLDCGSRCHAAFPAGTQVELVVTKPAGTTIRWSGCTAAGSTCRLALSKPSTVRAVFAKR